MPMSNVKMRDDDKICVEASTVSGISAFLGKLWKMVEDSKTDHLISWGKTGTTFVIKNQIDFAKTILPNYYKHNNIASFIRQLNMYGFHKIVSTTSGSLDSVDNDEIEFSHPNFVRGRPFLLEQIKRKMNNPKENIAKHETNPQFNESLKRVLTDVKQLKGKQEHLDSQLSSVKQENEILWRELSLLRQKHAAQQNILNKLIRFLVSLAQPTNHGLVKRRLQPLMLKDSVNRSRTKHGPIIQEGDHVYTMRKRDATSPGPTIHEIHSSDAMDDVQIVGSPILEEAADLPVMIENETTDSTGVAYNTRIESPDIISAAILQNPKNKNQLQTVYITPDTDFLIAQPRLNARNSGEYVLSGSTSPNALMELVQDAGDVDDEYITVMADDSVEFLPDNIATTIITEGISDSEVSSQTATGRKKAPTVRRKTAKKSNTSVISPSKIVTQKHKTDARRKSASNVRNISKVDKSANAIDENFLFDVNSQNEPFIEIHTPVSSQVSTIEEVPTEQLINIVSQNSNANNNQLRIEIPSNVDEVISNISPSRNSTTPLNVSVSPNTLPSPKSQPLPSPVVSEVNLGAGYSNTESDQILPDGFMKQMKECIDNAQNMSLACSGNSSSPGNVCPEDITNQINTMQTDLNSLKEIMQSQPFSSTFPADAMMNIFNDDLMDYSLPVGNPDQYPKSDDGNELINSNTAPVLDLNDLLRGDWFHPETPLNTEDPDYCSLNTPQIGNHADESQPLFPPPSKKIRNP